MKELKGQPIAIFHYIDTISAMLFSNNWRYFNPVFYFFKFQAGSLTSPTYKWNKF